MARVSSVAMVVVWQSICILLLTEHLPATANSLTFFYNFSDPTIFSHEDLYFEGDAYMSDGSIILTGGQLMSTRAGRVSYRHPVPLRSNDTGEVMGFSASISFIINSRRQSPIDTAGGLAFFLGQYPSTIPLRSEGGYLGLFNSTTASVSQRIVAVEVDTHGDAGWDPIMSPHVGVDVNTLYSGKNIYMPTTANLVDGLPNVLQVDYNDVTKDLVVVLRDFQTGAPSTTLKTSVDLRRFLPRDISIGVAAATSDSVKALHRVLWWSFNISTNRSSPVADAPGIPTVSEHHPSLPQAADQPHTTAAGRNKSSVMIKIVVVTVLCMVTIAVVALLYLLSASTIIGRHYGRDRAGSRALQAALLATCSPRSWMSDM